MVAANWHKRNGTPKAQTAGVIEAAMTRPPNPASEVTDAVEKAYSGNAYAAGPKWPERDAGLVRSVLQKGSPGLYGLWEASPVRFADDTSHAEEIIPQLFPGNPLICCGRSKGTVETNNVSQFRGRLARMQFIVPSPMSATAGMTKAGEQSPRSLSNVGPRRFLVVEFDPEKWAGLSANARQLWGDADRYTAAKFSEQAAILLHLANYAPLVLAVHSAGKSVHGWFLVAGEQDEKIEKFFTYACRLGADPATWTRNQLVRMPDGWRRDFDTKTKKVTHQGRQSVLYFNPSPIKRKEPIEK